jgi:hypothetical protein
MARPATSARATDCDVAATCSTAGNPASRSAR